MDCRYPYVLSANDLILRMAVIAKIVTLEHHQIF